MQDIVDVLNEAGVDYDKFELEMLDVEKFVKVNDLQEVSDPVFFNGPTPSPKGLLSNEIFGITKAERAGIYAYMDLGGTFINPIAYKTLCKLNNKIPDIVNGTDTFKITSDGDIVQDPDGNTGIDWLRKNFNSIKFKDSDSKARSLRLQFLKENKDKIWIKKYPVIPAYYRDVDTKQASIGVGEINKLYSSLLLAAKSLKETADYGLTLSESTKGRIQNIIVQIFDWFGAGTTINGVKTSGNLPGKTGLIKKGTLYKTVDYSVRLVLSAPDLEVETIDDMMVDMDHAALPLAAAICNFKPYILFWLRRFFENQFAGNMDAPYVVDGVEYRIPITDYQVMFSDVELEKQIEKFIHGYSNRFVPIPMPYDYEEYVKVCKANKLKIYPKENLNMTFKGKLVDMNTTVENLGDEDKYPLIDRPLTWCDLLYMAASDVTEDKMVLVTRFPIDSYLNQFPTKVRIRSTTKTEPILINNKIYKWYPHIRANQMYANTSPLFADTFSMSNALIDVMGADFDGDTVIVKPIYTIEANQELAKAANSKVQMIGMNGISTRVCIKESLMVLYSLTYEPDKSVKLVDPVF